MTLPIVRLAAASPLYAPIYLAHEFSQLPRLGEPFDAFRHVELDYAPSGPTGQGIDPLIRDVLTTARSSNTHEILAVGDPLRMLSALPHNGYDAPYVLGGMITKMCFSLLVSRSLEHFTPQALRSVVVHPKGWTSYCLYWHFATAYYAFEKVASELVEAEPPGEEETWYKALDVWPDRHGRRSHVVGLVSSDVLRIMFHRGNNPRFVPIRHFYRQAPYSDAVMTALITGNDLRTRKQYRGTLDGIRAGIARAIERLIAEPDFCAYYLTRYRDSRIRFSHYSREELCGLLAWLGENEIYNVDSELRVTNDQVHNALDIRQAAPLPDSGKIPTITNDVEAFFNVRETEPPSNDPATAITTWRNAWNDETTAAERTAFRDKKMPVYVLAALVPLALLVKWATDHDPKTAWSSESSVIAFGAMLVVVAALRDLYELGLFLIQRRPDPRLGVLASLFNVLAMPAMAYHGVHITSQVCERIQRVALHELVQRFGWTSWWSFEFDVLPWVAFGIIGTIAFVTTALYWIRQRAHMLLWDFFARKCWRVYTWLRARTYAIFKSPPPGFVSVAPEQLAIDAPRLQAEAEERVRAAATARATDKLAKKKLSVREPPAPEATA